MMDMCVAYGGKEWNELLRSSIFLALPSARLLFISILVN